MIDFDAYAAPVLDFIRARQSFAPAIVFALAFGESIAFLSLLIPATVLLLGIGALIQAGGLDFWSIWFAAVCGAVLGDALSYWFGLHFKQRAKTFWPLSRRPDLVQQGEGFFARFGIWGVAVGRFFGPARAVVPLIAGILAMPQIPFQVANVLSALVWAFVMLAPGAAVLKALGW
ncbi:DedA family protein [Roseixanthobacter glucoisosaccharinicivorans]|uniref:DedA family protein n=1 Tax=Roseixanthobacter glucoisosaccharinicivorans TaxID=3119923 RepID=UPI0037264BC1